MAISELYTPPSSNFSEQIWVQKCLLNKQTQRSIVKKGPIFTLNIPKIRCKTPWYMGWKWVIFTQFAGGWGTHSGRDKADVGWMRKMVEQMINSSKIHELITYSANVLLSILSPVNMRATLLRFVESWNAAVNYTDRETPWTRIIEHKWFEFGKDENGNELGWIPWTPKSGK